MDTAVRFADDNEILRETATRLIDALGLEGAIYICRSNYWHGVLRLVMAQGTGPQAQPRQGGHSDPDSPARLHSLPQAATRQVDRQVMNMPMPALAA